MALRPVATDFPLMDQLAPFLAVAAVALWAGAAVGVRVGRGQRRGATPEPAPERGTSPRTTPIEPNGEALRARALEASAEPILIVSPAGRVVDCNAAALLLFDRHRSGLSELDASVLRTLLGSDGTQLDWDRVVAARAPASLEAHVRLPDGSRRPCTARLVPLFSDAGAVTAVVEVYEESAAPLALAADRFLQALDDGDAGSGEPVERAHRELALLSLGLADLERVVRQYERLLPAVRAEDPLSEAIAGLAAETRDVATSANVPRLLQELPRSIERLRDQLKRFAGSAGIHASRP